MSPADTPPPAERTRTRLIDAIRTKTIRSEIDESLPRGLRVAASYAWRFVVLAAAIGILIWVVIQLN